MYLSFSLSTLNIKEKAKGFDKTKYTFKNSEQQRIIFFKYLQSALIIAKLCSLNSQLIFCM